MEENALTSRIRLLTEMVPTQGLPLPEEARADGAEGQDGGPAPVPALQVLDDGKALAEAERESTAAAYELETAQVQLRQSERPGRR